ncbi:MAG: acyltransferase [Hyphomicrobiaceae bacterium]|nr:acyltransferase [Hyphomicrobiaceae bacterium]
MTGDTQPTKIQHAAHLDMLRGIAALAVVAGHSRGFVLVDFATLQNPDLSTKLLYLCTSLGHQAVIAFFALSGFLVGGRALSEILAGGWSPAWYCIARLTRLWTVVLPALAITFLLDTLGRHLNGATGYDGVFHDLLSSGPSAAVPADTSLLTLLANVSFLQTIVAPTYGTNSPLWSLANEFWYYAIAPLGFVAAFGKCSSLARLVCLSTAIFLCAVLPTTLVVLGGIWMLGALMYWTSQVASLHRIFQSRVYSAVALSSVVGIISAAKWGMFSVADLTGDLALGMAFSLLLPGLAAAPASNANFVRASSALSNISFTLYATHFPLLAFLWFTFQAPSQLAPGAFGLAVIFAYIAAAVMTAALLWWMFERRTHQIRQAVSSRLSSTVRDYKIPARGRAA